MLCILPWSFFVDYLCILPQQSLCVGVLLQNQVAHDEKKTAKPRKVSAGSLVLVQEIKDIIIEWGWLLAQLANGNASQDSGKTSKWNAMMDIPTNHSDNIYMPRLMTSTNDQKCVSCIFVWGGGNFNQKLQQKIYRATPRKTNMSPENQWLEDVFPIEIVPF